MTLRATPLSFVLLSAALVLCWSSGFVGIRYATDGAGVAQILFGRSIFSGLVLLPLALWRGPRITAAMLAEQGAYAFLGMFLYLGGFALAIGQRVPTGLVALMADLVPLAIALMSARALGQPLTPRQWHGTGLAVTGVVAVSGHALHFGAAPVWAYALPLMGMLAFAASTLLQERRRDQGATIVQRLALQCLFAALMFAPFAALDGGLVPPVGRNYVIGMAWLVVLATFGGWLIYYLCLRLFPAAVVSATIYLSPPLTLVWAWALFDEPLTLTMAAGLGLTLTGVALVAAPPSRA